MRASSTKLTSSAANLHPHHRAHTIKLALAFLTTYLVWGSTYLGIRFAIETIPPLVAVAIRHSVAGGILLAWALARGFRPRREHWIAGLIMGALYFALGHGLLHWAEKSIASGIAALLIATEPMFILLIGWGFGHHPRPHWLSVAGLVAGMVGVGILVAPGLSGHGASTWGLLAAVVSSIAWSAGVCVSSQVSLPENAVARTALPLLCGAAMLWISAFVTGEWSSFHVATVSLRSWLALGYLIGFGTILAFTAYTWLLMQCSPALVATHTYANPVVAVLLGWMLAGEPLGLSVIVASVVIVGSIGLIRWGERAGAREGLLNKELNETALEAGD